MSKSLHLCTLLVSLSTVTFAGEFKNVEYLCADWGPSMTLPSKPGENPHFSETEYEIYFLKQVSSFTRKHYLIGDLFSGSKTEDIRHGVSIYLCKMKPDGSEKTDIKELWKNPNYPIDTQGYSCWMDLNKHTHKIALSVLFAGSDVTGLWTMGLDGSGLERAITPSMIDGHLQAIDSPSWMPGGEQLVFAESLRGGGRGRIVKCDIDGRNRIYLTEGPGDRQPSVSPDGKTIAYVHMGDAKTGGLYLMGIDGANPHLLPNPDDKRNGKHSGINPTWSADGKRIFATAAWVIDVASGKKIPGTGPRMISQKGEVLEQHSNVVMAHWGKLGLVCAGWGGGITVVDEKFENQRIVALSETEGKP